MFAFEFMNDELNYTNQKQNNLSELINLPFHHRDPFDRLLAAQTLYEKLKIISVDSIFDSYNLIRHS